MGVEKRMKLISKAQVYDKIRDLPEDKKRDVVCALIGHSRIVTTCFGYVHCARCEQQIGDTLIGIFDMRDKIIVGHNCDKCILNSQQLIWRDTFMTPDWTGKKLSDSSVKQVKG